MKTLSYCAKQVTAMGDYIIDRDLAALDEPDDARDELIAKIKDEMVERRKAAMSDDDIQASLEGCNKGMAGLIRDAITREDGHLALATLKIMLGGWLQYDCEIEAIKSVEALEKGMH